MNQTTPKMDNKRLEEGKLEIQVKLYICFMINLQFSIK